MLVLEISNLCIDLNLIQVELVLAFIFLVILKQIYQSIISLFIFMIIKSK